MKGKMIQAMLLAASVGGLALSGGLIPQELYNLILAGAMLSIIANPFLFRFYDLKFARKKPA